MGEIPPTGDGGSVATAPKTSRVRLGKILLAIIILWIALDICFMILGVARIGWLQDMGLNMLFYSLLGIPVLALGSVIAFIVEPKGVHSENNSKKGVYLVFAVAFGICALIALVGILYALVHWVG